MTERSFDEQLTKHLTDAHSIEVQALEQMRRAPDMAGDPDLARIFREHCDETVEHERLVREALEARDASPSAVKDLAGRTGGWGMVLFAKLNPDTPGKLAMHAYSYEHMELAAYELLRRMAERAGDAPVAALARRIGAEERAMADRIGERWDRAVDASLREKEAEDLDEELAKYLRDAHALEAQALQMLEAGPVIAEREPLGSRPGRFQAAALRGGALNLGGFFKVQPDTPVKLAGFAYAFEALECGAYELLWRTAERAGDAETANVAKGILLNEQDTAQRVAATWDAAVHAALAMQGVTR
jgi:ferritin-like metal-binding protein YciE